MNRSAPFELTPSDIQESWGGHYARLRGSTIRLRHEPTGVEVTGEVPQVHSTNRQLRAAEAELRTRLVKSLTEAVAKHLRIPGR